ncbi:E3 SUMO-protein ligase MMS21 [Linum perenne]
MQTELGETGPVQDPVVGRIKRLASVISSDNNTLVADMRKAFNTIKDIAVELEKENQSTQVKELESVATQISESCDNCIRLTSAVNTVGDKYQPTTEYTDFKKLLDEEFKKLLNTPSQNDRLMRQFRESIWPMPGEEQEDIIMTSTQSNLLNEKCPITGKMITELAEPVRSVDCKHIYEKEAVMAYIHRNSNKKCCVAGKAKRTTQLRTYDYSVLTRAKLDIFSFVTGCPKFLEAQKLVCDPFLLADIDELRSRNRGNELDQLIEDFTFDED